jgi:stage V sporulation protein G
MEVTDVRIRKLNTQNASEGGGKMRASVSVTFDNEFVVHDIKVIQGEQKNFIAMPSRKVEDGTYKDITHPIKSELRTKIQDAVLSKYEDAIKEAEADAAVTSAKENE